MRALLLVVLLAGCGPAHVDPHAPGQPCDAGEPSVCASSATTVVCEKGKWLEYPCDGVLEIDGGSPLVGLCRDAAPRACILPVVAPGDFCPEAFEGPKTLADGGTWLGRPGRCVDSTHEAMCRGGVWRACRCSGGCFEESRMTEFQLLCGLDLSDPCWGI